MFSHVWTVIGAAWVLVCVCVAFRCFDGLWLFTGVGVVDCSCYLLSLVVWFLFVCVFVFLLRLVCLICLFCLVYLA